MYIYVICRRLSMTSFSKTKKKGIFEAAKHVYRKSIYLFHAWAEFYRISPMHSNPAKLRPAAQRFSCKRILLPRNCKEFLGKHQAFLSWSGNICNILVCAFYFTILKHNN